MKRSFINLVLVFLAFYESESVASVILQFDPPRNWVANNSVEEDGFIFSSPKASQFVNGGGLVFRNPPPGEGNYNGLNTVPCNGSNYAVPFTGSEPVLRQKDDLPFRLYGFDLAEYSKSFDDPHSVAVTGYYATGGTIATVLQLDGRVEGLASDFETFTFDQNWNDLNRVVMFASVPWVSGVGFSVDNIEVSVIPEPSGIVMIGLVSGCALFIRRKFTL